MTDTRELASALAELEDDRLLRVLERGRVAYARLADLFEIADALLAPESILGWLGPLPRATVQALTSGSSSSETQRLAASDPDSAVVLLTTGGAARSRVRELLTDSPLSQPVRTRLAASEPPVSTRAGQEERGFERAFLSTVALSEVLQHDGAGPAVTARGALTLADAQALGEVVSLDVDSVQELAGLAQSVGYARPVGGRLRITREGADWLTLDTRSRWRALCTTWWERQPAPLRRTLADHPHAAWDDALADLVAWSHPALPDDPGADAARLGTARALGLVTDTAATVSGAAVFANDQPALARASRGLPKDIHTAFVQHDMTVIAPGPLDAASDAMLHRIAVVEQRSYASRYRLSETSLRRGQRSGIEAAAIGEQLRRLSSGAIPQPLDYLLDDLAARPEPATSVVPEPVPDLVDQPDAAARAALARLRESSGDSATGWLERQLREAARLKSPVVVTVRMPNGDADYILRPTAVAAGRLRALDAQADVERTLPLSSIAGVRPSPADAG